MNYKNNNHIQLHWSWWRWIILGLATLALVLSAIMSWHNLMGGTMAGCGGGSPCEQVLNSSWSRIAGILPVSGLAMGVYLAVIAINFFLGPGTETPVRRMAWKVLLILMGSIVGSAIWFFILQNWIIGDFCPWCMTAHTTGLLLAVLVIRGAIKEFEVRSHNIPSARYGIKYISGMVLIGLLMSGLLAASQVSFNRSVVYSGGNPRDEMPTIDYEKVPMVGSPDASYIVTLLFDYQCSQCQKVHFMLNEAVRHYNGSLAFALFPAPLNSECNPFIHSNADAFKNSCDLARIGMAVWLADRVAFPVFEDWMFMFESGNNWQPRNLETARGKAIELVGQTKFDAAFSDPWIGQYLQTAIQIYGQTLQNGMGGIPKMIFGPVWVIPQPDNAAGLIRILQQRLAVPMP